MLELIEMVTQRKGKYKCHCGNITEADKYNVASGKSKSCGCLRSLPYAKKHGMSGGKSKAYLAWKGLRHRCTDPNYQYAHRYSGRGIGYDPRWDDFENFLEDMGEPELGQTLDRKDNDLGYSKENCRWASIEEQANNKSNNRTFVINGKRQTLSQLSKKAGLESRTVWSRLETGMSIKKALTKPLHEPKLYEYQGRKQTLHQWAKEIGVDRQTLANRLNKGIPIDVAFSTHGYLRT